MVGGSVGASEAEGWTAAEVEGGREEAEGVSVACSKNDPNAEELMGAEAAAGTAGETK